DEPTADLIWVVSAVSRGTRFPVFAVSENDADKMVTRADTPARRSATTPPPRGGAQEKRIAPGPAQNPPPQDTNPKNTSSRPARPGRDPIRGRPTRRPGTAPAGGAPAATVRPTRAAAAPPR